LLFLAALSALFLVLLIVLGAVSVKLFSARDPKGGVTAPGCLGGCATMFALIVIALLGLAAFLGGTAAITASRSAARLIEAAPDMKVGVWRDRERYVRGVAGHPLHVVFQWSGHSEPTEALLHKLEEIGGGRDADVRVSYEKNESGEDVTIVDVALRASSKDAEELEKAIHEVRPDLDLSEGVEVTLRKVEPERQDD